MCFNYGAVWKISQHFVFWPCAKTSEDHFTFSQLTRIMEKMTLTNVLCLSTEPIVRNGRPPSVHSVHSFLHQYTGSFKKPPLRRPQSVIGGGLGSLMAMPRNGSRLGKNVTLVGSKDDFYLLKVPKNTARISFYGTTYKRTLKLGQ